MTVADLDVRQAASPQSEAHGVEVVSEISGVDDLMTEAADDLEVIDDSQVPHHVELHPWSTCQIIALQQACHLTHLLMDDLTWEY